MVTERADVSSKMVSLIEREQRNPTLDLAYALAQGLDVPLADLISEAEATLHVSKKRLVPEIIEPPERLVFSTC